MVVLGLHINGILKFLFFFAFDFFLSKMLLRLSHIIACVSSSFLVLSNISLYEYYKLCEHISVGGLLGFFQLLALISDIVTCTFVSRSLRRHICISLGQTQRNKIIIKDCYMVILLSYITISSV